MYTVRRRGMHTYAQALGRAGDTVDDSHLVPLYSVGMVFWAVLFNKFWVRREAQLGVEWGTVWSSAALRVRPEFKGATPAASASPAEPPAVASTV